MRVKTLSSSLTQDVYEQLRVKLLHGELRPDQRLKIASLCSSLDANLSAVREALSRLTSEGLVVSEPQKGFRVAGISIDDLLQLTEARVHIESLCLSDSIRHGDLNWEATIIASRYRLLNTPRLDRTGKLINFEWGLVHSAFHHSLVAACENLWLLKMRAMLAVQGERYRWLSNSISRLGRDLDKEHAKIAEAVLQRNAELAIKLIGTHFRLTAQILVKSSLLQKKTVAPAVGGLSAGR